MSTRLERALLAAGERVVRVPPKLMAGARSSARTRGKSDPIDALAIARAALREPDLPVACHDGTSRELKLLVDHREDLVTERTRMQNRLRWHLHELDPELDVPARGLDRLTVLDRLAGLVVRTHLAGSHRRSWPGWPQSCWPTSGPLTVASQRPGTGDHRPGPPRRTRG